MRQNALQTARARQLRRDQADAEKQLWYALRGRRFLGLKFRRQVPVGPYIVDFFCAQVGLIVEADGGQHADNADDVRRDLWLVSQGFRVVRYWNADILNNLPGVLARLRDEVRQ